MKICMFTNTYLPHVGGVAKSVALFSEDLISLGHKVLVIAPTFAEEMTETRPEGIQRVPAIQHFNGSDFSARIALPFLISNKIREFRPDIIHSHHPYLLGDAALRVARRNNIPMIFTHHTRYEEYMHYVSLESEQMKKFVINLSTEYANLCDGVIAPSRSIREIIRGRGVSVPIKEIPTGVDIDLFRKGEGKRFRHNFNISGKEPVIGHVGRLAPEKNIPYLARAVSLYLKNNKGVFVVVGDGDSRQTILDIFNEKDLSDRLIMTGVKNGSELVDAYNAMDLFVFASKSETQGMVLIEAMAAETPVIALDAPGVREVIMDGKNGRLLPAESSEREFAEAMAQSMKNRELPKKFIRHAGQTAEDFSRRKSVEKLLRFYKIASKNHPPREWNENSFVPWDKLLRSIAAEWELISEKASALINTIASET